MNKFHTSAIIIVIFHICFNILFHTYPICFSSSSPGTLDTNWTVGAVMEKKLMPLPFTLALSAMLNHPKNQFKLGCGFIIG